MKKFVKTYFCFFSKISCKNVCRNVLHSIDFVFAKEVLKPES